MREITIICSLSSLTNEPIEITILESVHSSHDGFGLFYAIFRSFDGFKLFFFRSLKPKIESLDPRAEGFLVH